MKRFTFILLAVMTGLFLSCEKSCEFTGSHYYYGLYADTIHYDEQSSIHLGIVKGRDSYDPQYSVEDATVVYMLSNRIRPVSIGTTNIRAYSDNCSNELSFPITVIPYFQTYEVPLCEWGKSKSHIGSIEKRIPVRDNGDTLIFIDPNNHFEIQYYFQNDQLKKCFIVWNEWPQGQNKEIFLLERYKLIHSAGNRKYYWDRKKNDYIIAGPENYMTYQPERPF